MSDNCHTRNPLRRDGTSQSQRLLRTLLPSYVAVDERSMDDLAAFAQKFSAEVQYYDAQHQAATDNGWEDFFRFVHDAYDRQAWANFSLEELLESLRAEQQTTPHLALFFGFLYLFRIAQEDLNTITERHLDFYYREVLQFSEKPAAADQVALIFKLAKQADAHLSKKGTLLQAGKDDLGRAVRYSVAEDTVVNQAELTSIKAVFANINNAYLNASPNPNNNFRVYASPQANSADGQGAEIETEEKSWRTFGAPLFSQPAPGTIVGDRPAARVGFAIASPQLFLAEGERAITLTINYANAGLNLNLAEDSFRVYLSGEEEWIEAEIENPLTGAVPIYDVVNGVQTLRVRLRAEAPAVVGYHAEVLGEAYPTAWPVLKVELNTEKAGAPYALQLLHQQVLSSIDLQVQARVSDLILQSDQGILDGSKPFHPFGNRPVRGSHFYVGSWEVFQKRIDSLALYYKWNGLPGGVTFAGYYANYGSFNTDNTYVRARLNFLDKQAWVPLDRGISEANRYRILRDENGVGIIGAATLPNEGLESVLRPRVSTTGANPQPLLDRAPDLPRFTEFNRQSQRGFLRLTLSLRDFGHRAFSNAYAKQAIALSKHTTGDPPELPNEPYTPTLEEFALEYTATETLSFGNANSDPTDQYFQLGTFGLREVDRRQSGLTLLPSFEAEGMLYLGITGIQTPQTLSLLFQVAEGSANPDKATQPVEWSYLADNEWLPFNVGSTQNILSDATKGLLTSGIIRFNMPAEMSADNTWLPAGQHWIRAQVREDSDASCRLIDVRAQAVAARFKNQDNDPEFLREPLAAETISKLLRSDSKVSKIEQPYASFGGRVREDRADFYLRVSERLRHKNRAITIWDYERLVLQNFPSVYKAKCLNHTCYDVDEACRVGTQLSAYSEMAPGHVTLIAVPDVRNKNAVDPLRPKVSLSILDEILSTLQSLAPPCIQLHVKNPIYEEVKVAFKVRFAAGYEDTGFYSKLLDKEITEFLAPWAFDCSDDIAFGGRIHKSMILNFVEERTYVDYVTCFHMYHFVPPVLGSEVSPTEDVDEAIATAGISILGSADHHVIDVIPLGAADDCDCEDNVVLPTAVIASTDDCACGSGPEVIEPVGEVESEAVEEELLASLPMLKRTRGKRPSLF